MADIKAITANIIRTRVAFIFILISINLSYEHEIERINLFRFM